MQKWRPSTRSVGASKSSTQTTTKKITCIGGADGPIVVVPALLKLARWCQQRKHSDPGEDLCDPPRKALSPPAPRAPQSACAAEAALGSSAATEAKGGAAGAEPTGDPRLGK